MFLGRLVEKEKVFLSFVKSKTKDAEQNQVILLERVTMRSDMQCLCNFQSSKGERVQNESDTNNKPFGRHVTSRPHK